MLQRMCLIMRIAQLIIDIAYMGLQRQTRRTWTMKEQGSVDPTPRLLRPLSRESLVVSSSVRELVAESSVVS
jgi:hypothetical protein